MPDAADGPDDLERARLRGKRIALITVIAIAVVYIAASAEQIIPAVFGLRVAPIPSGQPGSPERECAIGVRDLALTLDRGHGAGLPAERAADVERACSATPHGEDAWAALQRLSLAEQELRGRDPAALEPLRRDLAAHLPSDLR